PAGAGTDRRHLERDRAEGDNCRHCAVVPLLRSLAGAVRNGVHAVRLRDGTALDRRDRWRTRRGSATSRAPGHGDTQMSEIDFIQRARDLAPLLTEAGDEIERRRELPEHVVAALIDGGFFRMLQPKFLGGAELRPVLFTQVTEALA